MFKKIKLKDFIQLFVILTLTIIFVYFYVNTLARNKLWIQTYPIRANISIWNTSCSENAPSWLKEILDYQTKYNNSPSNQIAYIDSNNNLYYCENGYVGVLPLLSASVTSHTRFRYASVTKLWTSDAVLDLVKQGKIGLDDPLSKYITEINNPQDQRINDITIRQLLLHRAGFDRYRIGGHDMFGIGEPICPNNFERLNTITIGFNPNEKMSYSNLGYCLLGEVISRVNNNQSYESIISDKYNFNNTSFKFIGNKRLDDEVFYNYVETGLTGIPDIYTAFDYEGLASSAGLSGNAIDLAKQVKEMINKPQPNILSLDPNIHCNMTKLQDCYGYAMYPYQQIPSSPTVYYRDGALLGVSSLVVVSGEGAIVTLLSNGDVDNKLKIKQNIYQNLLHKNDE